MTADEWIQRLEMNTHPEGGYFKEIYRSEDMLSENTLPERYHSGHSMSTSIYYLLKSRQVSKFHKILSDEIWHFYDGETVVIHQINDNGLYEKRLLGNSGEGKVFPQVLIRRNNWFAAELEKKSSFALMGCTVSPGFDFEDFFWGKRDELINLNETVKDVIIRLT